METNCSEHGTYPGNCSLSVHLAIAVTLLPLYVLAYDIFISVALSNHNMATKYS